ncbi:MAG: sigma-E factor negative regulatory protein [Povalibacter sp.]
MNYSECGDADMTDAVKEQLSACLDGQLPEGELDLMLKRLQRDAQLRRTMDGYSLIGEAMRGQRTVRASSGFADRVAAAVAAEPVTQPAITVSRERVLTWLRPAAGLAIAAGVAAVAIISFRPADIGTQPVAQIVTDTPQADDAAASYTVPTNVDTNAAADAFVPAARLTNYVVAHSEYSSPLARRTVLSGVLSDDQDSTSEIDQDVQVSGTPESVQVEQPH